MLSRFPWSSLPASFLLLFMFKCFSVRLLILFVFYLGIEYMSPGYGKILTMFLNNAFVENVSRLVGVSCLARSN